MKYLIIYVVSIGIFATAVAEDGFHVHEYPGYPGLDPIGQSGFTVHQPDRPQPPRVVPAESNSSMGALPPSDAIVLFDGTSLDQFENNEWQIIDDYVQATQNDLVTKGNFGDFQMHVEWRAPNPPSGKPSNMGNSGLYIMGRYELQVFDSYSCKIYADGSAGAIYGQTPPAVNVCRKPGEWQSFDIVFIAPRFKGEKLETPAYITVFHNGILIHNKTELLGPTGHKTAQPYKAHAARLPINFQAHSSPVEYRNIWIRDLEQ